jgi:hypothetical protein
MLEVLDSKGALVRRYRSDDAPEPSAEQLARELIPGYWLKPPAGLPSQAGVHRWVWDLHYPAPISVTRGYPISAVPHATPQVPEGPLALPGNYLVRLTVDGRKLEEPLLLKQDPRVAVPAAALEQQHELAMRLARLLTSGSQAQLTAQSEQAQLKALGSGGTAADAIHAFDARLSQLLGSAEKPAEESAKEEGAQPPPPPQPNLKDVPEHIAGLYAELARGDGAPTDAQRNAADTAERALSGLLESWQQLQAGLPDLNQRLGAAKLAAVRADIPPPRDLNVADEE